MEKVISYQTKGEQCNGCEYQISRKESIGFTSFESLNCNHESRPFNENCSFTNADNNCEYFTFKSKSFVKKILDSVFD